MTSPDAAAIPPAAVAVAAPLPASRRTVALLAVLFAVSGAAGLILEGLAIRVLALICGNTVYAFSCVVSAFMLGLAVGSVAADRLIARRAAAAADHALLVYGLLEGLAGLYAALVMTRLLAGQRGLIAVTAALAAAIGPPAAHVLVALAVLLVPTVLLGATLPVAALLVAKRPQVSLLYATNTAGAAVGALLANLVLVPLFGITRSMLLTGALGVALLVTAITWHVVRRRAPPATPPASAPVAAPAPAAPSSVREATSLGLGPILGLALLSGMLFVGGEVVWTRIAMQVLGNRVYVTSIALAAILSCLGAGAALARLLAGRAPSAVIGGSLLAAGASMCAGLWLRTGALEALAAREFVLSFGLMVRLLPFLVASVVVPAVALAVAFPLALSLAPRRASHPTAHVGAVYAVNTMGCVLGSLGVAYGLLPTIGLGGTVCLQAGLAVGAAGALLGRSRRGRVLIVGAALLLVPTAVARGFRRAAYFPPAQVVVAEEDAHGLFQIVRAGGDELRVLADTTDLVFRFGDPQTAIAQSMQAHLGMLYAPQARAVLNIGTGYGITAGAFTLHRGLERIDTVEILPLLIAHRRRFASGNLGYDRDPRVHIHVADGRHFLATAPTRYDIISVNITDPYLPGNSSLHSAEFYQLVRDHLTPDGVLVQQVFGPDRATLVHQIRRYFPHLAAAPSYAPDLNVVASRRALALDDARLAAFFDGHSVPLGRLGFASATGLAAHLAAGAAALGRLLATPAHFVETDDRPVLEFRVVPGQVHWLHTAQ